MYLLQLVHSGKVAVRDQDKNETRPTVWVFFQIIKIIGITKTLYSQGLIIFYISMLGVLLGFFGHANRTPYFFLLVNAAFDWASTKCTYMLTFNSSFSSNGYLSTRWTGLMRNEDKSQHFVCSLKTSTNT